MPAVSHEEKIITWLSDKINFITKCWQWILNWWNELDFRTVLLKEIPKNKDIIVKIVWWNHLIALITGKIYGDDKKKQ